jgi:hypothetical protein
MSETNSRNFDKLSDGSPGYLPDFIDVHNAKRGCFSGRVLRA